jgi:hypothetical protein
VGVEGGAGVVLGGLVLQGDGLDVAVDSLHEGVLLPAASLLLARPQLLLEAVELL